MNPEEGLALIEKHKPDLILLDINLPGMNGYQIHAHLKSRADTQSIPVIGISADIEHKNNEQDAKSRFSHFVTKPINVAHFIRLVNQLLIKNDI